MSANLLQDNNFLCGTNHFVNLSQNKFNEECFQYIDI